MKLVCALSTYLRLASLVFTAGLVIGLTLGVRVASGPSDPNRTPSAGSPLATGQSARPTHTSGSPSLSPLLINRWSP
jgi:hypothetical protein